MNNLTNNKNQNSNWKIFNATDYSSLMYPTFMLCKINGFFPYKITSTIGPSSTKFTVYVILLAIVIYHTDISGLIKYNNVPSSLQGHCYLCLGFCIAFVSFIQNNSRKVLLCKLNDVTSEIPKLKLKRLSIIIHTIEFIGIIFLLVQLLNTITNFSQNIYMFLFRLTAMYSTTITYCIDKLYINNTCIVGTCFTTINEKLYKFKNDLEVNERHLLRRNYHDKWNPLLLMNIQYIMKQHSDISKLIVDINEKFGLQIVASVTLSFIETTFSLYFWILKSVGVTGLDIDRQIWVSYFITSLSYYTIKLGLMVIMCEECKKQSYKTGVIVHEILNVTKDREITDELQIFSLQLLHHDNTFTAKGLKIDATLLTSIVGGITTYFLILIQFLMASKSCAEMLG
ncbi:uncharacterized protein LOC130673308 [Microplitis mediator]|uniref:uncharacterized protein LOC130673308 n=1 Tax=Microplitis mediator TaxID=375433 RepID=UPI002556F281|nr:uncharacterized protein LOC130673308 [Microplitis mediator]